MTIAVLAAILIREDISRRNSLSQMKDSLFVSTEIPAYFEACRQTLDASSLISEHSGEVSVSSSQIDLSTAGISWIRYEVSSLDKYGQKAVKGFTAAIRVADTNDPVINLKKEKVSFIAGDPFDPAENILSVTDENYPDLYRADALCAGSYVIESDVDAYKPGSYAVTIRALDLNGNLSELTYPVTVEKKTDLIPGVDYIYNGAKLTKRRGTIYGPSGKETYYNLKMDGVINIMRRLGYSADKYPYWIREDGCKMFGDYIMIAANLELRPRGSLVPTSLGMGIVCDTGAFAVKNRHQIDIAVNW